MTKRITVAQFVAQQIKQSGKTHVQIAQELGDESGRTKLVEMIAEGRVKLPINKVEAFAAAVGVYPGVVLKVALSEYAPDLLVVVERIMGRDLATGEPSSSSPP